MSANVNVNIEPSKLEPGNPSIVDKNNKTIDVAINPALSISLIKETKSLETKIFENQYFNSSNTNILGYKVGSHRNRDWQQVMKKENQK